MRPTFDATLIGELRQRVISHNEAHPDAKVKLGELRKLYERNFRRSNPGARAMQHVDRQLEELAKADEFDESKHPRGSGGAFTQSTRSVAITLPATKKAHEQLQNENAGYRAITTDSLPSLRYQAIGGIVRDVGAFAAGSALVGLMAAAKQGSRTERTVARLMGSTSRAAASAVTGAIGGSVLGIAKKIRLARPNAADVKSLQMKVAAAADRFGDKMGARTVTSVANVVQGALRTAPYPQLHRNAQTVLDKLTTKYMEAGMSKPDAIAAAMPRVQRKDARAKRFQQRVIFGALSVGTGLGIRNYVRDSAIDPVNVGRMIDDFSVRSIQKAAGLSPELDNARRFYTGELAKNGPAGGSIEGLRDWLADGNHATLQKAIPIPWGTAARRIFTAAGALGGAAVGGTALYAASRATQHFQAKNSKFDEDAHPRASDGKFSSKAGQNRRFAQVGGLVGGAAAGIAVAALLGRRNARIQSLAVAALQDQAGKTLGRIRGFEVGASKKAFDTAAARTKELVETGDEFAGHREALKRIQELGASDPTVVQVRLQRAFHERIADMIGQDPNLQLPAKKGKGFVPVQDFASPGATKPVQAEKRRTATLEALGRMTREDFKTSVSKLNTVDQNDALKLFDEATAAVKNVPAQMQAHSLAVVDAQKHVLDLKVVETTAADVVRHAKNQMNAATDGPLKDAAKQSFDAATLAHTNATSAHTLAAGAAKKLQSNPTGVTDPFTGKNVQPPTEADLNTTRQNLVSAATKKATGIIEGENDQIMRYQEGNFLNWNDRQLAVQAARGVRYGAPRNASQATKGLADLQVATKASLQRLNRAQLAHGQNEVDMTNLLRATKRTKVSANKPGGALVNPSEKVMSEAQRKDLRMREPDIRASFDETQGKLEAATADYVAQKVKRSAAAAVFRQAMEEAPDAGSAPSKSLLSADARRDLKRVKDGLSGSWKGFVEDPTTVKLMELAQSAKKAAKEATITTKDGVKTAGKRAFKEFFTRDDGKGGRELSPGKIASGLGVLSTAAAGAQIDAFTLKDRVFGSPEKKAAARDANLNTRFEQRVDPISGAGYYAMTVSNPKTKAPPTVVWAERFDSLDGRSTPMYAGGTLADLDTRMKLREQQMQQQQRNGQNYGKNALQPLDGLSTMASADAQKAVNQLRSANKLRNIQTFAGGPSLELAAEGNGIEGAKMSAGAVLNHIGNRFGTVRAHPTGPLYHQALEGLFSIEGKTLTVQQVAREVTGFDAEGRAGKRFSIFTKNEAFGSTNSGQIATALAAEISAVSRNIPQTRGAVDNLHRAIAAVGSVKNLSSETMIGLHNKVAALNTAFGAQPGSLVQPQTVRNAQQSAPFAPPPQKPAPTSTADPIDLGQAATDGTRNKFKSADAFPHSLRVAADIAPHLGLHEDPQVAVLGHVLTGLGKVVRNSYEISDHDAITALGNAFKQYSQTALDAEDMRVMLSNEGGARRIMQDRKFLALVSAEAKRLGGTRIVNKAILLDDLDALMKLSMGEFIEQLHPRVPTGSATAGEFVASRSSAGSHVAGEVVEEGGKKVAGPAVSRAAAAEQGWAHPVRFGNEFGSALGYEAAFNVASQLLPLKTGTLVRLGLETVAGMAGGAAGEYGGNAAGQAIDRAQTGKRKGAEYNPPDDESLPQALAGAGAAMGAGLWGNSAGGAAGLIAGRAIGGVAGSLGGPIGAIALGTVAGYAGQKIGSSIYGMFAGYDTAKVDQVMHRFAPGTRGRAA